MKTQKFWLEDPCSLFMSPAIFPTQEMSKNEKLNALTRLSIVIAVALYASGYENSLYTFIALALFMIIVLKYGKSDDEDSKSCSMGVENFTTVPTYHDTDMHRTVVTPTYAEEWAIKPRSYDIVSHTAIPEHWGYERENVSPPPRAYPYGQYLTKTNLLPSDEYKSHMMGGGPAQAREYINSTFLRHDIAFRDNISRVFKKKLNRRFRHNCQDTYSPYNSW